MSNCTVRSKLRHTYNRCQTYVTSEESVDTFIIPVYNHVIIHSDVYVTLSSGQYCCHSMQ